MAFFEITHGLSSTVTNVIVGDACLSLLGKTCKLASTEAFALYRKSKPRALSTAGVELETSNAFLNNASHAESVLENPATTLLNKTQTITQILESGKKFGCTKEQLIDLISLLEKQGESIENLAIKNYEITRNISHDIEQIAQNTGIQKEIIETVKNHLFIKEHNLGNGKIAKFDPCPDIFDVWERLSCNKFVSSDLDLLLHEYHESVLMDVCKMEYTPAHEQTMKFFPWKP